jgi:L-alanine-DL-glutamate epimerase-like enolase superfamily enzyme
MFDQTLPGNMNARAAIDLALHDAAGKALKLPAYKLLGGLCQPRIPLEWSISMAASDPGKMIADAERAVKEFGIPVLCVKAGGRAGWQQDTKNFIAVRKAVGPDFDLMVDAHTWWRMGDRSYSAETVDQLAKSLAAYDPAWLEEPLPPDDHEAYRVLKERDYLPIASGEHEPNEERYLDLILTQSVDYVQMDVCCQGGFAMGRRVCEALAREKLRFAFHSWGTTLEVLAAAHFGICFPEKVVEWLDKVGPSIGMSRRTELRAGAGRVAELAALWRLATDTVPPNGWKDSVVAYWRGVVRHRLDGGPAPGVT